MPGLLALALAERGPLFAETFDSGMIEVWLSVGVHSLSILLPFPAIARHNAQLKLRIIPPSIHK